MEIVSFKEGWRAHSRRYSFLGVWRDVVVVFFVAGLVTKRPGIAPASAVAKPSLATPLSV